MVEIKLSVKGYKCERCSHEWIPRKTKYPVTCPKCKSPYWDKPRVNKIKEESKNTLNEKVSENGEQNG